MNGTIDQIYESMAVREQAAFSVIDPAFQAFAYAPSAEDLATSPFPCSFRMAPEWTPNERMRGEGSNFHFDWEISVVILMGFSSGDYGALTKQGALYIPAFYQTYRPNRTIDGRVRGIEFGKGYMGDMRIHGQGLFGLRFPIMASQILVVPSRSLP